MSEFLVWCWRCGSRLVQVCDHCQCIKIDSVLSDGKRLLYGMLQVSVLGSILFLLFSTPLTKMIENHPGILFHFYVDDMQSHVLSFTQASEIVSSNQKFKMKQS